jgi:hypothetical protein
MIVAYGCAALTFLCVLGALRGWRVPLAREPETPAEGHGRTGVRTREGGVTRVRRTTFGPDLDTHSDNQGGEVDIEDSDLK